MNFHNLRTLATRKTDGSRLTGSAAVGYNFLDGHPRSHWTWSFTTHGYDKIMKGRLLRGGLLSQAA